MSSKFSYKKYPNELFYVEDLEPTGLVLIYISKNPIKHASKKKNDNSSHIIDNNNLINANTIQELYQYSEFSYPQNNEVDKNYTEDNCIQKESNNEGNPITYEKMNINSYKNLFNHQEDNHNNYVDVNINLNYDEGMNDEEIVNNSKNFTFKKNYSVDKFIIPQNTYIIHRPKSADRIQINQSYNNYISNNNQFVPSTVEHYFERRHNETKEKLNKIKNDREKQIEKELVGRPKISDKTKRIIEKLNNNRNVFDRLTNNGNERKRQEKIQKIQKMMNKNMEKPEINEVSRKMNRNIDNLLEWKREVQIKKERNIEESHVDAKPRINYNSQIILNTRNPDYLVKKVEDRLHTNIIHKKNLEKENNKSKVIPLEKKSTYKHPLNSQLINHEKTNQIHEHNITIKKTKSSEKGNIINPPISKLSNKQISNRDYLHPNNNAKIPSVNKTFICNQSNTNVDNDNICKDDEIASVQKHEVIDEGEIETDIINKLPINEEIVQNENSNEEREKLMDVRKHLNMYLHNKQKAKSERVNNEDKTRDTKTKDIKEINPSKELNKNQQSESLVSSQSSIMKKNVNSSQIYQENRKNYEEIFQKRREMLGNVHNIDINSPGSNVVQRDLTNSVIESPKEERNFINDKSSNVGAYQRAIISKQDITNKVLEQSKRCNVIKNYKTYISKLEKESENMNELDRISYNFDMEFQKNNYEYIYNKNELKNYKY